MIVNFSNFDQTKRNFMETVCDTASFFLKSKGVKQIGF